MENQFRKYIARASEIKNNLCCHKSIANTEGQVEGRLKRCDKECDGLNTDCEDYITKGQLEPKSDREDLDVYEIPDNSTLARLFEKNHPRLYYWLNTGLGRTYSKKVLFT